MLIRAVHALVYLVAALALVLGAAMIASAPAGAATWSAPQTISAQHTFIRPLALEVSGAGQPVAAWEEGDLAATAASAFFAVAPRGGGTFGTARALPAGTSDVVTYGRDRLAALIVSENRIRVASGPVGSGVRAPVTVANAGRVRSAAIAANVRGDVAVAWVDDQAVDTAWVSLRPRGSGRFGPPKRMAREALRSTSVALGPDGEVVVAWNTPTKVRARVRPAGGGFKGPQTLNTRDASGAVLRTAISRLGRVVVGWRAQARTEGGTTGTGYVQVSSRSRRATSFTSTATLATLSRERFVEGFDLATLANGRIAVAWTGFDGTNTRAYATASSRGGRFSAPIGAVSAAGRDAEVTDLAAGDVSAMALWHEAGFPERNRVFASVATDTGPFTFRSPEAVSPDQGAFSGLGLFLAEERSALALFGNRPTGLGPPTVAQVATRR